MSIDRAPDARQPILGIASLHEGEARPEQQLVIVRRQGGRLSITVSGFGMAPLTCQLIPRGRQLVRLMQLEHPGQLRERLVVVLDPQLTASIPRLAGCRHDHDRRGLTPPNIATHALGSLERRQQAPRKRPSGGFERRGHRLRHPGCSHHVRLSAEALAGDVARVRDAALAGVARDRPGGVDRADLAEALASSSASSSSSAASMASPASSRASSLGPYAGSTTDWVATAPTPARAHGTTDPTENQCD